MTTIPQNANQWTSVGVLVMVAKCKVGIRKDGAQLRTLLSSSGVYGVLTITKHAIESGAGGE